MVNFSIIYGMDYLSFTVTENDSGRRLDKIARRLVPELPLSAIYKHIRKGFIKLNGCHTKAEIIVKNGDVVQVAAFLEEDLKKNKSHKERKKVEKTLCKLDDVFKNRFIRIINKPYNIPVHSGGQGETSLNDIVYNEYIQEYGENSLSFVPGPLHRLDKKTTGLVAFSQNLAAARWFSKALHNHCIQKTYIAILQGKLESPTEWDEPIAKKHAHTSVLPVDCGNYNGTAITIAKVQITTGRTHQIRIHCSSHGFPLLGDTTYGGAKTNEPQDFFLHAMRMGFPSGNPLDLPNSIFAPLPSNFTNMLEKCLSNFSPNSYNINGYEDIF